MQRNFLWGGAYGDKNKVAWVSWKDVFSPKEDGGLGVRDIKWFNMSFLTKWRWRLLTEEGFVSRVDLDIIHRHLRHRGKLWWTFARELTRSRYL
jgi:hypothetical protein